jgi:hypothetical protein
MDLKPIAVMLDFVNPAGTDWRLGCYGRKAGRDEGGRSPRRTAGDGVAIDSSGMLRIEGQQEAEAEVLLFDMAM